MPGSDPAAVVFDALAAAKARNADVLIVDTAGRLHNKKNLMEELKKIIEECIAECGATSMKEMGMVMKLAKEKTAGRADNKTINEIVKSLLG